MSNSSICPLSFGLFISDQISARGRSSAWIRMPPRKPQAAQSRRPSNPPRPLAVSTQRSTFGTLRRTPPLTSDSSLVQRGGCCRGSSREADTKDCEPGTDGAGSASCGTDNEIETAPVTEGMTSTLHLQERRKAEDQIVRTQTLA